MEKSSGSKYRHEYKYICDAMEMAVLCTRIRTLMSRDSHCDENGNYQIRSLYFDDFEDRCYYENESGIGERDKYRIRIYNADREIIHLEKKSKNRGMTMKKTCSIDEDICRCLMRGIRPKIQSMFSEDLRVMLQEMEQRCLRPVVIVEYIREPFVCQNGNTRITFDKNIRSSNEIDNFLEKDISARPIMEKGKGILEVKWDEFLPDYIAGQLQLDSLQWSSFSKYYLCRRYNNYGGLRV